MSKLNCKIGDTVIFTRFGRLQKGIITKEYEHTSGEFWVRATDGTHYPAVTVGVPDSFTNIVSIVK